MAKRNRRLGFSLLELTVVITLLAILAALVAPRLTSGFVSSADRAHVRRLLSLVRSAREHAVLTGQPTAVRIDSEGTARTVQINDGESEELLATLTASVEWRVSEESSVEFFADGSSSGGTIAFARSSGDEDRELHVDEASGTVEWRVPNPNEAPTRWEAGEMERRG